MKILMMCRMITYNRTIVYGLNRHYLKALHSWLALSKPKDSQVDLIMVNRHKHKEQKAGAMGYWEDMTYSYQLTNNIAKKEGYDYLLILDPDMILPQNALIKLIATKGDVVTAIFPERPSKIGGWKTREGQPPNGWLQCMPWNKNKKAEDAIRENRIFHVTGCGGGGCTLLNRKAIESNLFVWSLKKNSPDFSMWINARRSRLVTLCNPTIKCKHIEPNGVIIEGPKYAKN